MRKLIKFGDDVEGYNIPVLNEREIRAAAGILFLIMFTAILTVVFKEDFLMLKYAIILFLTDMLVRVFISPRFSPTLIVGRLIVSNQVPEYVGAKQKQFAWIIGVALGIIMFVLMVAVNSYSPITGLICLICLIFLFFEAAFGICIGCKFYSLVYKEKAQYCPGEVCDVKSKQPIQKTSWAQLLLVFLFIVYMILAAALFNVQLSKKPFDLFGIEVATQQK